MTLAGSRAKAAEALKAGRVTLDGAAVGLADAGRVVQPGQRLALAAADGSTGRRAQIALRALAPSGITLLHEDRALVAIAKPAGLLSDAATFQQRKHEDNAVELVRAWAALRHGPEATCLPVHRIDRDTSGVLLLARTPEAEADLKAQFAAQSPERVYWAIVVGSPAPRGADPATTPFGGTWENWMRWDPETNRQLPVPPPGRAGAEDEDTDGVTLGRAHWRWLGSTWNPTADGSPGALSLLEVRLVTGRRNQIRLQAALAGLPLLGERLYHPPRGATRPQPPANTPATSRQALHARSLTIRHPDGSGPKTFTAPPPADFARLLRYVGHRA